MAYYRGWSDLRHEDRGLLWEHFILNELHAHLQRRDVRYWRDKRGHEIDFVWAKRSSAPTVIECKWTASEFDPTNVKAFRYQYPHGDTFVVAQDVRAYSREYADVRVRFVGVRDLVQALTSTGGGQPQ